MVAIAIIDPAEKGERVNACAAKGAQKQAFGRAKQDGRR
jgi:hypothetical protein